MLADTWTEHMHSTPLRKVACVMCVYSCCCGRIGVRMEATRSYFGVQLHPKFAQNRDTPILKVLKIRYFRAFERPQNSASMATYRRAESCTT